MYKHIIAKFAKLGGYLGILVMSLWLVFPAAAAGDFTGTWETVSSEGNRGNMQLQQSGNTVSGTLLSPQNGTIHGIVKGTIHGIVKGKVLDASWSEGGQSGTGTFRLSGDGNAFTGTCHTTGQGEQEQVTLAGKRK